MKINVVYFFSPILAESSHFEGFFGDGFKKWLKAPPKVLVDISSSMASMVCVFFETLLMVVLWNW